MTNYILKNKSCNKKNSLQTSIIDNFLTVRTIFRDYITYYVAHYIAHDK